jgi:anti-sigma factor RsiW
MKMNDRPVCHRAEDLVTSLYGEASAAEARDFAEHTRQCDACRAELALFRGVHESILDWRNDALGMTTSLAPELVPSENPPAALPIPERRRLSAIAAVRQFFGVSPLWLRGATTFAALLLVALLVFVATRSSRPAPPLASNAGHEQLYTAQQLQDAVNKAVYEATSKQGTGTSTGTAALGDKSGSDRSHGTRQNGGSAIAKNNQRERARVPGLTRAEREQLAADLRLIPGQDDEEFPFILSAAPDQR